MPFFNAYISYRSKKYGENSYELKTDGLEAGEYGASRGTRFTAPGPVIQHQFAGPGTYTVMLRVMDNNGAFSPVIEKNNDLS